MFNPSHLLDLITLKLLTEKYNFELQMHVRMSTLQLIRQQVLTTGSVTHKLERIANEYRR
jgi:hypothetical protein